MKQEAAKKEAIDHLRREILAAEGLKRRASEPQKQIGLQSLEKAFPDQTFPIGCIHEFISPDTECAAATVGFIAALLSQIGGQNNPCIWISRQRGWFPPALISFGLPADQVIFIHPKEDKDLLWTAEQALKCPGLAAVIADVQELDLTASRRLQLAVEKSRVTGFLHRQSPRRISHTACVARWEVRPLACEADGLPGVGSPRWQVNLLKVRNGHPGSWEISWLSGRFHVTESTAEAKSVEPYEFPKVARA